MNKQHKEVLEEYLVKKEKLLTHFKKYERAFPARDIKDLSNRTKALRYAIDILGRVDCIEESGIIDSIVLMGVRECKKINPSVVKVFKKANIKVKAYLKGE